MIYEEFEPSAALRPWIASHWRFSVEETDPPSFDHVIVPDGTLSLSLIRMSPSVMGPIVFAGPSTTAHRVPVQRGFIYEGARIQPFATGSLLGVAARQLRARIDTLESVSPWASEIVASIVQDSTGAQGNGLLFERAVATLAARTPPPHAAVVTTVNALLASHGIGQVSQLASRCGLGTRQLRRKFLEHVGLSIKEFARIRRIRHACMLMLSAEDQSLASVSQDGGYADQPHFTREFRNVFGAPPRMVDAYLKQIEHVTLRD